MAAETSRAVTAMAAEAASSRRGVNGVGGGMGGRCLADKKAAWAQTIGSGGGC